jgi:nitroreductase
MDVLQAIAARYSYRGAFTDEPIPHEDLERIVQAGLQAPSASNTQTTSYVIIEDSEKLTRLADIIPNSEPIRTAKAVLVVGADRHDPQSERADFGPVNYGASVQNVLLAATGLGYATLWMEGWKRTEGAIEAVTKLVGLPDTIQVQVLIPMGVAAQPGQPREKRPFGERAWWNEYSG